MRLSTTTFVTANGVINPAVASFDVNGDSASSNAARFLVGQVAITPGVLAGGGVFQSFISGAGILTLTRAGFACLWVVRMTRRSGAERP